jgi:hypothetical protein
LLTAAPIDRFRSDHERTPDPYFPNLDVQILDHLRKPIQRLNTLLAEGEKLREHPRKSESTDNDQTNFARMTPFMEVVREVLEMQPTQPRIRHKKGLPADFDPRVYVLLNPDLKADGVNPVKHYLQHGVFEGRAYRFG